MCTQVFQGVEAASGQRVRVTLQSRLHISLCFVIIKKKNISPTFSFLEIFLASFPEARLCGNRLLFGYSTRDQVRKMIFLLHPSRRNSRRRRRACQRVQTEHSALYIYPFIHIHIHIVLHAFPLIYNFNSSPKLKGIHIDGTPQKFGIMTTKKEMFDSFMFAIEATKFTTIPPRLC